MLARVSYRCSPTNTNGKQETWQFRRANPISRYRIVSTTRFRNFLSESRLSEDILRVKLPSNQRVEFNVSRMDAEPIYHFRSSRIAKLRPKSSEPPLAKSGTRFLPMNSSARSLPDYVRQCFIQCFLVASHLLRTSCARSVSGLSSGQRLKFLNIATL